LVGCRDCFCSDRWCIRAARRCRDGFPLCCFAAQVYDMWWSCPGLWVCRLGVVMCACVIGVVGGWVERVLYVLALLGAPMRGVEMP